MGWDLMALPSRDRQQQGSSALVQEVLNEVDPMNPAPPVIRTRDTLLTPLSNHA